MPKLMGLIKRQRSSLIRRMLDAVPGKRIFGMYRFMPFFFVFGGALEFSMINWTVGDVNFCKFKTF